jgi:hypothetical protein
VDEIVLGVKPAGFLIRRRGADACIDIGIYVFRVGSTPPHRAVTGSAVMAGGHPCYQSPADLDIDVLWHELDPKNSLMD